jgi:hypothetical protein
MAARIEPAAVAALMEAARSARDRALLTLLWRCGQRIGDWSAEHGRHGVLGMRLGDLDRASSMIVVSLKGARDEHRVPVSADFWPLFAAYLPEERGLGAPEDPLALPQLVAAAGQVGGLGAVARQLDGFVVGRARLVPTAQPAQQVGAGGVVGVIAGQPVLKTVDGCECHLRAVELGDRDGPVEGDDR